MNFTSNKAHPLTNIISFFEIFLFRFLSFYVYSGFNIKMKIMNDKEEIVNVFTGSRSEMNFIKQIFEDNDIPLMVKKEYYDGGVTGYATQEADLLGAYVMIHDKEKALKLVEEFKNS